LVGTGQNILMKHVLPPNYAMQRAGTDKVPGRGRMTIPLLQANHARVPMAWRAVADGGRYASLRVALS
jgi:hypothetical protein